MRVTNDGVCTVLKESGCPVWCLVSKEGSGEGFPSADVTLEHYRITDGSVKNTHEFNIRVTNDSLVDNVRGWPAVRCSQELLSLPWPMIIGNTREIPTSSVKYKIYE